MSKFRGMSPQTSAEIRAEKGLLKESKLQRLRIAKGFSQSELTERSGVALRAIQCYEQQTRPIENAKLEVLCNLCIALECKLEDIIEDENLTEKIKQVK